MISMKVRCRNDADLLQRRGTRRARELPFWSINKECNHDSTIPSRSFKEKDLRTMPIVRVEDAGCGTHVHHSFQILSQTKKCYYCSGMSSSRFHSLMWSYTMTNRCIWIRFIFLISNFVSKEFSTPEAELLCYHRFTKKHTSSIDPKKR